MQDHRLPILPVSGKHRPRYRLHTEHALATGEAVELTEGQRHYLGSVLRAKPGEAVALFNGRDGEWWSHLAEIGKNRGSLMVETQLRPQSAEVRTGLWLLFAPLKKHTTDMIIEKATELGVSVLWPVLTRNTNAERVNVDRLRANAIEAAEQCERLSVPEVRDPAKLSDVLRDWPGGRTLYALDESGKGAAISDVLAVCGPGEAAFLVGPEGGFAAEDHALLRPSRWVTPVVLGPRILRAETAAMAALTCWQVYCGDWRNPPPHR